MIYTKYTSATEAQKKLQAGINKLNAAVSVTLGAKGRLALIQRLMQPAFTTKDGVTVAREFILPDQEEQAGVDIVKYAAKKTADQAGDGTTATIILANAIINEGLKAIEAGENPVEMVEKIREGTAKVIEYIKANSTPLTTDEVKEGEMDYLKQVATIAANGNEYIGGIIAEAYRKVGKNGFCNLGEALSLQTEIRYSKGLQVECGYTDSKYATNYNKMTAELVNPLVLIYENKVLDPMHIARKGGETNGGAVVPGGIIFEIAKMRKPVLFMCDGLDETSTATLLQSFLRKDIQICVTKLPSIGEARKEILKDIAALTGATIIGTSQGIKISDAKVSHCGTAAKVTVGKDFINFEAASGNDEAINKRAEEITGQLQEQDFPVSRTELATRLARLTSGIATIHVGANTEVEQRELRDRVEDAVLATRSALEEGVVVGGGLCLFNAGEGLDNSPIKIALSSPLLQLLNNAGIKDDRLKFDNNFGYNVATNKQEDLFAAGIVDAAKVPRCAIQNASSVACQLLLTKTVLIQSNPEING